MLSILLKRMVHTHDETIVQDQFTKQGFICPPLRLLVFGAGAIGTYIGGSLALGGQQVVFLETPQTRREIEATGLHLELGGERRTIPSPRVADSLPEALSHGPFDAAVFALKSFDTASALEAMRPYADRLPPILCLQNGVENEAVIAGLLGEDRVIAGTVTSAVGRRAAGDIILEKLRGVGIAAGNPLSSDLVSVFSACGLNARLIPSAEGMKWSKMLTNLLSNATSAILGMTPAEVFGDPGLFRLEAAQLHEALHVMHRLKIPVVDLPGTPVRMLAFAIQKLPLGLVRPLLQRAVGGGTWC